jgi:hypothetical protein
VWSKVALSKLKYLLINIKKETEMRTETTNLDKILSAGKPFLVFNNRRPDALTPCPYWTIVTLHRNFNNHGCKTLTNHDYLSREEMRKIRKMIASGDLVLKKTTEAYNCYETANNELTNALNEKIKVFKKERSLSATAYKQRKLAESESVNQTPRRE